MTKAPSTQPVNEAVSPTLSQGVDETKNYALYESYYTCLFFRLWGRAELQSEITEEKMAENVLLGNMQNFLDEAFGDVAGRVNGRFFLIEFKVERGGIRQETVSKEHRKKLLQQLENETTRGLSLKGHFAGYADSKGGGSLKFEPYYRAALQEEGERYTFSQLYSKLAAREDGGEGGGAGGGSELCGWSNTEVSTYVKTMYEHLDAGNTQTKHDIPQTKVMLGVLDLDKNVFYGFVENFDTLLAHLFRRIQAAETNARAAKSGPSASAIANNKGAVAEKAGSDTPAPEASGVDGDEPPEDNPSSPDTSTRGPLKRFR